MACKHCGHDRKVHGDRAVFPACEGGYNGKTLPDRHGVSQSRYQSACFCPGYEVGGC